MLATAIAAALGCGSPSAVDEQELRNPPTYLALGDSVPFGYDPLLVPPPNDNVFNETSYPWHLAQEEDIPLVNASCPGQTSEGFLSLAGSDNGCFPFRAAYGLHVDYSGSQLAFALGYLEAHPRVRLITIALGANDLFLLLGSCSGDPACILDGIDGVLGGLSANMAEILGAIRATGYTGQIIVPLYYNPSTDPLFDLAVQAMDYQVLAPVAAAFGGEVADVYVAFATASAPYGGDPCNAGLLIPLPGGGCDVHPSAAGAQLIADTIAPVVAPWTGKP
jgi:lysophospholipase L1-like esterase